MLAAGLLTVLAVLLAGPAPRLMARIDVFRRTPGPALLAWQSVSLAAVLSALLIAPAALLALAREEPGRGWTERVAEHPAALGTAAAITALMAGSLIVSGHRVGSRLRALRRRHRALVDLLTSPTSLPGRAPTASLLEVSVRVLEHPGVSAYCLPGLRRRVVLSRGAIQRLSDSETSAVLAHERAHLQARHDLILEFFTVLHRAVPPPVRSAAALSEVHLLVEALADRSAIRRTGAVPLARALVALGGAGHPDAALGIAGHGGSASDDPSSKSPTSDSPSSGDPARIAPAQGQPTPEGGRQAPAAHGLPGPGGHLSARLRLIADHDRPTALLTAAAGLLSITVLLAPIALLTLAW